MYLIDIVKKMKPYLPLFMVKLLGFIYYRIYMTVLCAYLDRTEKATCARQRLPQASLRYRVNGTPQLTSFLLEGKRCSKDLLAALAGIGKQIDSFKNVLDFGCGCGRTLRWFENHAVTISFAGTDIDVQAINFCQQTFGAMHFSVNSPLPPLEFHDDQFDLIYSISVLTHLNEEYQFRWLEELKRIVKPEGIVLLSIHGQNCWSKLPAVYQSTINTNGFLFIKENVWKGIYPEWYQTSFHTETYVREKFSTYFLVLDYLPKGISEFQDLVILQKRNIEMCIV